MDTTITVGDGDVFLVTYDGDNWMFNDRKQYSFDTTKQWSVKYSVSHNFNTIYNFTQDAYVNVENENRKQSYTIYAGRYTIQSLVDEIKRNVVQIIPGFNVVVSKKKLSFTISSGVVEFTGDLARMLGCTKIDKSGLADGEYDMEIYQEGLYVYINDEKACLISEGAYSSTTKKATSNAPDGGASIHFTPTWLNQPVKVSVRCADGATKPRLKSGRILEIGLKFNCVKKANKK